MENDLAAIDGVKPIPIRVAAARWDSAISANAHRLIFITASMKWWTTTGANSNALAVQQEQLGRQHHSARDRHHLRWPPLRCSPSRCNSA
jgi:hypothetical protein